MTGPDQFYLTSPIWISGAMLTWLGIFIEAQRETKIQDIVYRGFKQQKFIAFLTVYSLAVWPLIIISLLLKWMVPEDFIDRFS